MHESPNDNVNNNLINDLLSKNENLTKEVPHLENIKNLSKTELSCKKVNKNLQQIIQKNIYKFYSLLFPTKIKNFQ